MLPSYHAVCADLPAPVQFLPTDGPALSAPVESWDHRASYDHPDANDYVHDHGPASAILLTATDCGYFAYRADTDHPDGPGNGPDTGHRTLDRGSDRDDNSGRGDFAPGPGPGLDRGSNDACNRPRTGCSWCDSSPRNSGYYAHDRLRGWTASGKAQGRDSKG
uniref:Uncharacterized protein n=1 Tax=Anopheles melas TaxID=34690 RepID=A0A182U7E6_9DIPT